MDSKTNTNKIKADYIFGMIRKKQTSLFSYVNSTFYAKINPFSK